MRKTVIEKCFYCGESICDSAAIRWNASGEKTVIVLHDLCAINMGQDLLEMGKRGISLTSTN